MSVCVDIAWKSLNKHNEELCGDKVEVLHTEDSDIVILADGMGSGVKANILATLTSKILGTMFLNGAEIESCVETIARTLPICQVRKVAYATFSILQISHDGSAYLVEFDNPSCVFVRDRQIVDYPYEERFIEDKKIREYRFRVQINDCFVLMSDGVIYAGVGELLNFGWTWKDMAQYTLKCTKETLSASRLAAMLSQACYDLYGEKPGDDTTVAVVRVIERRVVNIFTGPPTDKEDDEQLVSDFMKCEGKKVVCGGTSANIAARVLKKEIVTSVNYADPSVPPTASIEGLDLVTEGVLTLGKALGILRKYEQDEFDEEFFNELDADNGASKLAKLLIEECTDLNLFVGKALNPAHQNSNLPFDLSVRMNLVEQLKDCAEKLGKTVKVKYY
ncbi:SpoIIE family protein phosphatase [Lachnospiraceae bacterium DSM 108991]|uniref:SpoIIE family protein phosphatase n=1 Tax=Claveliimonas monacensis TaxID=2779351 RepID=A0ABR9RJC0_9FIRM|nr:SpoIIE family protein phosphatase [Claveliimonas monacensis]MBE5063057.1 SpoIIE family protein phosphatase [Claveliimonas monacensis]